MAWIRKEKPSCRSTKVREGKQGEDPKLLSTGVPNFHDEGVFEKKPEKRGGGGALRISDDRKVGREDSWLKNSK